MKGGGTSKGGTTEAISGDSDTTSQAGWLRRLAGQALSSYVAAATLASWDL